MAMRQPQIHSADIFHVQTGSNEPIYRQIMAQVVRLQASGQLFAGDTLPSVREVAITLGVNPMTVSKAYSQLESEHVLERQRGVGMTVARNPQAQPQDVGNLLRPSVEKLVQEARQLGLSADFVKKLVDKIYQGQ